MTYPFIQCRWRTATSGRRIDLVVLHSAETPEGTNTARAVANYFRTTDNRVSAHFCVDAREIIQSCRTVDVAYAAPGANSNGVHVELSGRAAQTVGEWHDPYSTAMLKLAAPLVAELCVTHRVPIRYVNAANLAAGGAGARGITTHNEVSRAFRKSTHTDPGPNFPIVEFVNLVLGGSPVPAPPAAPPALVRTDQYEVDMVISDYTLTLATDNEGRGWDRVPFARNRIVGHTAPGLRPEADRRYLVGQVGFADEGTQTVVSVTEWAPNSQCVVTLSVRN